MLWVCSIILSVAALSCAAPAQAMTAEEISARMDLLVRKVRALPYGGVNAPADKANAASPSGAVDAFLDAPIDPKADGGDSSSDIDSMIAQLEAEIRALEALEAPPPPAPVETPAEVAAEVQEQAPAPQEQAPQPDPDPAQPGPDHSNKEDGDGDGNNGGQQQQDTGPGGVPEAPQAPEPAQQGNGVDWGNEDTKS